MDESVKNAYRDSLYRASWLSALTRYWLMPYGNREMKWSPMPADYRQWREGPECLVYAISGGDGECKG